MAYTKYTHTITRLQKHDQLDTTQRHLYTPTCLAYIHRIYNKKTAQSLLMRWPLPKPGGYQETHYSTIHTPPDAALATALAE